MEAIIDDILRLGSEHRSLIKEATALGNMLRARVVEYVGREALMSGEGRKLDRTLVDAQYRRLVKNGEDPAFTAMVQHLQDGAKRSKQQQDRIFRQMGRLVEQLPINDWLSRQNGVSSSMLGKIIAEAGGDLSMYSNPAKLWKRFGLAVMDGRRQGDPKDKNDADEWVRHGYCKARRSVAYQMGEGFVKQGKFWRAVYDWRKAYECVQATARGLTVKPQREIKVDEKDACMSEGHVHARAKRYTEKKFLEFLWIGWTGSEHWRSDDVPEFIKEELKAA